MRAVLLLLLCMATSLVVGCDPASGRSFCERYRVRLGECGLLTEGGFGACVTRRGRADNVRRCFEGCVLDASCEDLHAQHCGDDFDYQQSCQSACAEAWGEVLCEEDGFYLPEEARCDGFDECPDGSDELGCPLYACLDGSSVVERARCDGYADCGDGSDEVGCPETRCEDGSTIFAHDRCDGYAHCADRSDEMGCPGVLCFAGSFVIWEWQRCDEEIDCEDGSDEQGCPQFACANGRSISLRDRCDGVLDCGDGSDEEGCARIVCE